MSQSMLMSSVTTLVYLLFLAAGVGGLRGCARAPRGHRRTFSATAFAEPRQAQLAQTIPPAPRKAVRRRVIQDADAARLKSAAPPPPQNRPSGGKLLSKDEQSALALKAQQLGSWDVVRAAFASQNARQPSVAEWAEACGFAPDGKTFAAARRESKLSKSAMIAANLGLVIGIARRYRWLGLGYEDLVQEGTFGLAKAVDKFDTDRGVAFSTYATLWIKQAIATAVMSQGRTIRLPEGVHKQVRALEVATRGIVQALGRDPAADDLNARLSAQLNVTSDLVASLQALSSTTVVSYDAASQRSGSEGGVALGVLASLSDPYDPESDELRADLATALDSVLLPREAAVIRLRYGIGDGQTRSNQAVADLLGCGKEMARSGAANRGNPRQYRAHEVRLHGIKALDKLKATPRGEALVAYMSTKPDFS